MQQHSLKLGGTNYHFKWVKVPGTSPYWKTCIITTMNHNINMSEIKHNLFSIHMYIIYGLTVMKFKIIGEECISPPVTPTKGHPSFYQVRFQMYWDNTILLNCPPQEGHPSYKPLLNYKGCGLIRWGWHYCNLFVHFYFVGRYV